MSVDASALCAILLGKPEHGIEIGTTEQRLAIEAFDRFGKGQHPATLNMGDCFAYACARSRELQLLYKGEDFVHTDIVAA